MNSRLKTAEYILAGLVVKTHEIFYTLIMVYILLALATATFKTAIGAVGTIFCLLFLFYVLYLFYFIYKKLNRKDEEDEKWPLFYLWPLLDVQGLHENSDEDTESKMYFFKRNYQLFNYIKKTLIIFFVVFGSNFNVQLIPMLLFQIIWLLLTLAIRPFRSIVLLVLKVIADILYVATTALVI